MTLKTDGGEDKIEDAITKLSQHSRYDNMGLGEAQYFQYFQSLEVIRIYSYNVLFFKQISIWRRR